MAEMTTNDEDTEAPQDHASELENANMHPSSDVELIEPIFIEDTNTNPTVERKFLPFFISHSNSPTRDGAQYETLNEHAVNKRGLAVVVPPIERRWEYQVYEEPHVSQILEEYDDGDYLVQLDDGREELMSLDELDQISNGASLLTKYNYQHSSDSKSEDAVQKIPTRGTRPARDRQHAKISSFVSSSDDELVSVKFTNPAQRGRRPRRGPTTSDMTHLRLNPPSRSHPSNSSRTSGSRSGESASYKNTRRSSRVRTERATRKIVNYSDAIGLQASATDNSEDEVVRLGKRKRSSNGRSTRDRYTKSLRRSHQLDLSSDDEEEDEGVRRSGRNVTRKNMREVGEDYIPEKTISTANGVVKYTGATEFFKTLAGDDDFRLTHCQTCDTCGEPDDSEIKGNLVYCQGCTLSYHHKCLGPRHSREHLVTKVGRKDFILQCRRCLGVSMQKDPLSPDQGLCLSCHEPGESTAPFRDRKSTKEEQKDREDNGGEDPITEILPDLVNNRHSVLFRCLSCYRACHMRHLPPKSGSTSFVEDLSEEDLAARRFSEYHLNWVCNDCANAPAEVESLVAWRPSRVDYYEPGLPTHEVSEEIKEYLVKWKKMSYFQVQWKSGTWVWGMTAPAMRKAFAKKDDHWNLPKMTTTEAIPEDYLRVDIVLTVEYTSVVKLQREDIAKARINEIKRALVKFKGLGYEDVVWIEPSYQKDTERWEDFKAAYEDWVMGAYIHQPNPKDLKAHLTKVRTEDFASSLEMKIQPASMTGGKMMAYQLEGLNWIYYQWYKMQNAILADEMGLGKTIQVIGFLAALKEVHGCWPFLVVVPNSTCPNWRREIKQWAPSLRVVSYYGSAEARKQASKYELFPEGNKNLGCHVVVTSYDAAQDHEFRQVFRGVHWAGLVVDEGQRLKNDKSILYGALNALKPPFKLLLTGTPLQNNARELFNLLQFLDSSISAQQMEDQYATLTKENVAELHNKLRKCFLRRTKAEVLTFLPPMAQIILPVSMSFVQKKLYKSILAESPELIKSILNSEKKSTGNKDRTSLNNMLMQLRKCLCHPFVYNKAVEEKQATAMKSHRGLVDASNKLKLLELMLPKLQERGHRVLIFSQFLDMLDVVEDFLDGLGLSYERLDGRVGSLQKQKKIDAYNAPNSQIFAFLLSTRAGGVGINLATADTVIIMDPDFNPHQDIQALSRAHRIGQRKKVLVFQLTTRASAEEKIMQIGKKKMALDQVLIEQMDAEEAEGKDIESILRYGTEALFKDDDSQDIVYDSASVDKLLDRSQVEDTQAGSKDHSAESQFSFAKVWVNDKGTLEEGLGDISEDTAAPDLSVWIAILAEREKEAAKEAAAKAETLGRGRRRRQAIDYSMQADHVPESSPGGRRKSRGKQSGYTDSDDTDFQESDGEEEAVSAEEEGAQDSIQELEVPQSQRRSRGLLGSQGSPISPVEHKALFKRAVIPRANPPTNGTDATSDRPSTCLACGAVHLQGCCPLKRAGVEVCNLCGLAHFGYARICPHLNSVTQLRLMLEGLKDSIEPKEIKDLAKKKITGIIGDLNQRKRRKQQEVAAHQARLRAIKDGEPLQPLYAAPPYAANGAYVNGGGVGPVQPSRAATSNGAAYLNHGEGKENATARPQYYQPPPRY